MSELKERAFVLLNTWVTCDTSVVACDLDVGFIEYDPPQKAVNGLSGLGEKLTLFHKVHTGVSIQVIRQIASDNIVCTAWLLRCAIRAPEGVGANALMPIVQPGVSWTYFANGKITKNRIYRDLQLYLSQRGYSLSEPQPATPTKNEAQS